MNENKKSGFELTLDNGIGLLIGGILLRFLTGLALFLVPAGLVIMGIIQIMRGYSKEGVPNIALGVIIGLLAGLIEGAAHIISFVLIGFGIIAIVGSLFQKRKR